MTAHRPRPPGQASLALVALALFTVCAARPARAAEHPALARLAACLRPDGRPAAEVRLIVSDSGGPSNYAYIAARRKTGWVVATGFGECRMGQLAAADGDALDAFLRRSGLTKHALEATGRQACPGLLHFSTVEFWIRTSTRRIHARADTTCDPSETSSELIRLIVGRARFPEEG